LAPTFFDVGKIEPAPKVAKIDRERERERGRGPKMPSRESKKARELLGCHKEEGVQVDVCVENQ